MNRTLSRALSRLCPALSATFALALATTPAVATTHLQTTSFRDRIEFGLVMANLDQSNTPIDAWATTAEGDWIVVADEVVHHSSRMSPGLVTAAKLNLFFGRTVEAIDCRADGLCVLVHDQGIYGTGELPSGLASRVSQIHATPDLAVRDVELTGNGGWVVLAGADAWSERVPFALAQALDDRLVSARSITDVGVGFEGDWVVLASGHVMSSQASPALVASLKTSAKARAATRRFLQGPGSDFVTYNHNEARIGVATDDPTVAVEYLLAGNKNIWDRMALYDAVGVSIAIIDGNEVVSARGYGVLEAGGERPVLGTTPFDIASLSKYVGALTTLREAELNPSFTMARDVAANPPPGGAVEAWVDRVDNEKGAYGLPDTVADVPAGLTLTRLFSHTASMRMGGSPGVDWNKAILSGPSETVEWLSGRGCDGWPCAYDGGLAVFAQPNSFGQPGNRYNYSNAGIYLAQAFVEDVSGATGAELMEEHLFEPMGLADITGRFPLPLAFRVRRAAQHDAGVLQTAQYYPMTFAGGVTASSKDYAELMVLALDRGRDSAGVQRLSPASIQALLTRTNYNNESFEANPTHYGLGVGLRAYTMASTQTPLVGAVLETGRGVFTHTGRHEGQARSVMCGMPSRDQGIVAFVNGDGPEIDDLLNEILAAFEIANGWPTTCGRL